MRVIKRELIKENTEELKGVLKKVNKKQLIFRIQMLIFLKDNPNITLEDVSNLLPVSLPTLYRWWGYYKEGGLEKLLQCNVKGYEGRLSQKQIREFIQEIEKGRFSTQKEMSQWIYEKFGIKYSQQGISDMLKRLDVKKKTARPANVKKDESKEKEFKEKVFKQIVKENKDKDIFFDESRFGLITSLGKIWNLRGVKTVIKTIMKFEYTYLYKAVNPKTGESFSLIMSGMNTDNINKFLEEFKKFIKVPEGIKIYYLPPYTPELNPVERVFQEIKRGFKNKIFDNLDRLEDKLMQVLNSFTAESLKSLTFYPYIREAFYVS